MSASRTRVWPSWRPFYGPAELAHRRLVEPVAHVATREIASADGARLSGMHRLARYHDIRALRYLNKSKG